MRNISIIKDIPRNKASHQELMDPIYVLQSLKKEICHIEKRKF